MISKRYLIVFILGIIAFIFLINAFNKLPLETMAFIMITFLILCFMALVLTLIQIIDLIQSN